MRGRAIPRATVQSQSKGHKEGQGKKSRFRSLKISIWVKVRDRIRGQGS